MTGTSMEMQLWWDWFARINKRVRGRAAMLASCEAALKDSASDADRQAAIAQISRQVHALEQDAIMAERLRRKLGVSRASLALTNVTAKLDRLSSRLCDLVVAETRVDATDPGNWA